MKARLLLVAMTFTKRPLGERLEMEKRLKLSLKQKFQKIDPCACAICAKEEYFKG